MSEENQGMEEAKNPLLSEEGEPQEEKPLEGKPDEPQEQQQPEELDFGGRKVPVTDPTLKELHGDWTELNRSYQQTNQRLQDLERQNQQYQQMFEAYQQQTPKETEEDKQRKNEELMNRFYEDPSGVLDDLVNQRVNDIVKNQIAPQIEPIQQERQVQQQIQQVTQKYNDFQQYVPKIQEVLSQNPKLAEVENGLEYAYLAAKGMSAPSYSPDQLLNDPNVKQQILANEEIRNQIISDYTRQLQDKNGSAPTVMGGQPGGQPAAPPEEEPKTWRDATKQFMAYLNR